MKWSNFTRTYFKLIFKNKYDLDDNNRILLAIKNERNLIKQFIKENKKKIDINIDVLTDKNIKEFDMNIDKYSKSSWVDRKGIINDMKNLTNNYIVTWSQTQNDSNNIYIKCTKEQSLYLLKKFTKLIYIIEYIKEKTNNNKPVTAYLVLTTLEKKFPKPSEKIMDVHNANTAYTHTHLNYIFIWRYEEFEKVLLHEIIHFLDLDCREQYISKKINIEGEDSMYEAITDYFGIYYYIIYLSLMTHVKIQLLLEVELAFMRNQAFTLNNFYRLSDWKMKPTKKIKQRTPAFSYYIVKFLLFIYMFDHDIDEIKDYNKLLDNVLINGMINKYKDLLINIKSSRMTLLQLK